MKKHTFTKFITAAVVMLAMLAVFSVVAFAEGEFATVSTDAVTVARGEEVAFSVSIDVEGIRGMAIVPQYDTNVFECVGGDWTASAAGKASMSKFKLTPVPNALLGTETETGGRPGEH